MIDIKGTDGTRTWDIVVRSPGVTDMPVDHLFDAGGRETFDPTEATEVDVGGELRLIEPGDTFLFILIAD